MDARALVMQALMMETEQEARFFNQSLPHSRFYGQPEELGILREISKLRKKALALVFPELHPTPKED